MEELSAMKRSDLVFAVLLVPSDFLMILAAGLAAYFIRFQTLVSLRPVLFEIPFSRYAALLAVVAGFFICVFAMTGLYRVGHMKIRNEIQKIFTACSTGTMLGIVFIFFIQELFTSRFIVLAFFVLSILCVFLGRVALRLVRRSLFQKKIGVHSIVCIGDQAEVARFRAALISRPDLGAQVTHDVRMYTKKLVDSELETYLSNRELDEIIVLNTHAVNDSFQDLLDFVTTHHVALRYSADFVGGKNLEIAPLAGIPLVEIKRTRLEGWGRVAKRIFDLTGSSLFILVTMPLMALIVALIRLESPGSPLYLNERVGQGGRRFFAFKFRSMYKEYCTGTEWDPTGKATEYELTLAKTNSERKGPVFKVLRDPRRTRVGRIIERFSLDELPQLFNVLFGTMSLVGPRPHMPIQVREYENKHHQLLSIKPGITGMAQVEGRSDLDFTDEARLDIFYIENWSLMLDAVILAKTPYAVVARKSKV